MESINVSLGSLPAHKKVQAVSVSEWKKMESKGQENMRLVPILVGVGVVAASAIIAKIVLDQRKKVLQSCFL